MRSAVLLKLMQFQAIPKNDILSETATVVEVMVSSSTDMNAQYHAIMCLRGLTVNMGILPPLKGNEVIKAMCHVGGHDVMAYVTDRMIINREDESFHGDALKLLMILSP